MARLDRSYDRREDRLQAAGEQRHVMRAAAYTTASAARRLAADLDAEAERPDYRQPAGWHGLRQAPDWHLSGANTRAALEVLDEAQQLVAAAVAADREAGCGWAAIGAALGVSADTASRRYRTPPAEDQRAE